MPEQQNYTVLIIDDNASDRELYKALLESAKDNYEFYEAETAKEATEVFTATKPDCVLLDYVLPDATGLHVLEDLMKHSPILPVVMLTGQGSEALAVDSMKKGAQDYLPKKVITSETLQRVVAGAIDRATLLKTIAEQHEALKREKERAEEASRAKSDFLSNMSHEIRTPMNAIVGVNNLLRTMQLTAQQQRYVDIASLATNSLLQIVNDILDLSKIEAGKLELYAKQYKDDLNETFYS